MKLFVALTAMTSLFATAVYAADLSDTNSQNKSQYTIFNPTPAALMRPINDDQIDNVFDAHTLDAGHFQVEANLVNYYEYSTRYDSPGLSYRLAEEEFSWTPRFRVGLCNEAEFEVNPTYSTLSENVKGAFINPFTPSPFDLTTHSRGFGDVGLGPKINLWGNDSGPTALAIHPYLSIPTGHGDVLGGADIPFGWQLPWSLYLKLETGVNATENSRHTIYGGFHNSASLHLAVCPNAELYCYLDSTVTGDPNQTWYGYSGFGVICKITRDLQVYGGIGFGLVAAAYDYNPRFGVILRF